MLHRFLTSCDVLKGYIAKIFDALDEKLRVETETYDGVDILGLVNPIAKEIGAKRGDVLRLMRYAVTGAKVRIPLCTLS